MFKHTVLGIFAALGLSLTATPPAQADHYLQGADPQLVQGVNDLIFTLGAACQSGNANACQAIPIAQDHAHFMLLAGYDCRTYQNQDACWSYQHSTQQFWQGYQQVALAQQQGRMTSNGYAYSQQSHLDRMQQIHNFGQSALAQGQANSALLDQRHEQFMSTIWD